MQGDFGKEKEKPNPSPPLTESALTPFMLIHIKVALNKTHQCPLQMGRRVPKNMDVALHTDQLSPYAEGKLKRKTSFLHIQHSHLQLLWVNWSQRQI